MRGVSLTMRETTALSSRLTISPYKRYVDDIYVQTTNEETADHFHHIINKVHPNLKFEIEKQKQHRVVYYCRFQSHHIQGWQQFFEFYKKPAKKPLFVHHRSAIPTKSTLNFIRNERKRIEADASHI